MSFGREFVAIHEDSLNVLRPDCTVKEADLLIARDEVLTRLVNDPRWLNWYGDVLKRDDDGQLVANDLLKKRREALREFASLLIDVSDWLLAEMAHPGRTRRLEAAKTLPKAIGVERLLFRATREAQKVGHRFSSSVWRLLLMVATGEIDDLGVIVNEPANNCTADGREDNHGYPDEPAE